MNSMGIWKMFNNQLSEICGIYPFLWCQNSYHGRGRVTSVMMLKAGLVHTIVEGVPPPYHLMSRGDSKINRK